MPYKTLNNLDPKLQKAASKLMQFQQQRAWKLRKLYPKDSAPLLHSLSPLEMLGISYTEGIKTLCKVAHARIEDHGVKWVLVSKRFKLEDNQDKLQAHTLGSLANIRIQFKSINRSSVHNAVVKTRVLEYLLALRWARLLIPSPESAFSLPLLAKIVRETLKLPHYAHIDTSLILGLRLMGYRVLKRQYGSMVIGCKLMLNDTKTGENS